MISGDPLTGRDSELDFLRRSLSGGKYSGVLIAGAAGVGKTRLARELLSHAAASGTRTNWIVGTESARPLPLGAFMASAGSVVSDPVPTVRRVISSLVAQQRQGRLLIGIDDAHLLDGFSAHVVHQLAQTRESRLVVTLRTGEDEPDAITALWKDGLLARLDLEPLSADATRSLIETTLGGPVDARSSQRFWKLTGGNALFLRQLLKDQIAAGRIRQVAGVWMWDGNVAVTQNISDMVGRQLGRLSPELALVVDTLSQCEPLDVDVLCDLASRRDLEIAEQMHLVTVERTGGTLRARLAHPLFGELRRATAGEIYLSNIRGTLARRLGDDADLDMQATVRRALLTLDSNLEPDPPLYMDAARYSMTLLDLELADRFATAAAECGVSEAATIRAMNMILLGRGEKADEFLRTISLGDDGDRHMWATIRAANLIWMLGRPSEAAAILEDLAQAPESPAQAAARTALEACVDAVSARCASAAEKARTALQSDTLSDLHAMMASVALVMASGALGDVDGIGPVADVALRRAKSSYQTSHMRFWFGGVYARASRLTGGIEECQKVARRLADSAKDAPGLAYANLVSLLGNADLMRGDLRSAVKLLHEALAGAENHAVTTGLRPACCFGLAEAHAKLGQAQEAAAALAEARHSVPPDSLYMQTGLALATGWTLAAAGSLSEAIGVALKEARVARDRGQLTHELACLQAAVQWGEASVAARAGELAASLSSPLADAVAAHAKSFAAGNGDGLLAASEAYKSIGDRAAAADAAAQAAVVFTSGQMRSRGLYAGALAQQLAQECGGLCTPAMRTPAAPTPLTGRQREVAELVAAGLSNREIADRLVTSVRTVEGHLYRACQRVGASSRAELAAIMRAGWSDPEVQY
ncbi:MAG: response regulator containing a CheY-like receiver domain and an DNA-binding domain [Mycobacterium sp.]|nr:response regulator containing a CheY-like receiver domain and an DNA-binding domain [Mycobacterium sp.]